MSPPRSFRAVAIALLIGSILAGCGSDSVTSPDGEFVIQLGCTTFAVPIGDFAECPLSARATGSQTAVIQSVTLLADGQPMSDFQHSTGLSFYSDPTPDNLAGTMVDGDGLDVDLRAYADPEVAPGSYRAGIRVTYLLGASSTTESAEVEFDLVVS